MKKRAIILCLFILPLFLFAAGKKETVLAVPPEAKIVAGVKVQELLKSDIGKAMVSNLGSSILGTAFEGDGQGELDAEMKKELGFGLETLESITLFFTSMNLENEETEGGIIAYITIPPADVKRHISEKNTLKELKYDGQSYFTNIDEDEELFIFFGTKELYLTNTAPLMNRMLETRKSGENITKNKSMNDLYNSFNKNMLFLAGEIPELPAEREELKMFQGVSAAGAGAHFTENLELEATLYCLEAGTAKDMASLLQLYIGMAMQMIPQDEKELREMASMLLKPIKINTVDNELMINVSYPMSAVMALIDMILGI